MSKELKSLILKEFIVRRRVNRSQLMKKCWSHYQHAKELDDILNQFQEAGVIAYAHSIQKYVMPGIMATHLLNKFRDNK